MKKFKKWYDIWRFLGEGNYLRYFLSKKIGLHFRFWWQRNHNWHLLFFGGFIVIVVSHAKSTILAEWLLVHSSFTKPNVFGSFIDESTKWSMNRHIKLRFVALCKILACFHSLADNFVMSRKQLIPNNAIVFSGFFGSLFWAVLFQIFCSSIWIDVQMTLFQKLFVTLSNWMPEIA